MANEERRLFTLARYNHSLGRRPIYLITFTVYALANLALALNKHSYAGFLVLRALQSVGASSVVSIAYGIVADVCAPAERGKILEPVLAGTNLGGLHWTLDWRMGSPWFRRL